MSKVHRRRQVAVLGLVLISLCLVLVSSIINYQPAPTPSQPQGSSDSVQPLAMAELEKLEIREHQATDSYQRSEFGSGWAAWQSCDTRQKILARDLKNLQYSEDNCTVLSGVLDDPYTGKIINFTRGSGTSSAVQIDHVVALSNAWRTGAASWERSARISFANDDLELIAVDGAANNAKSSGDAAEWLPSNTAFRCQYIARQIAVKVKYLLWVTLAEYQAMRDVLSSCPDQRLPAP